MLRKMQEQARPDGAKRDATRTMLIGCARPRSLQITPASPLLCRLSCVYAPMRVNESKNSNNTIHCTPPVGNSEIAPMRFVNILEEKAVGGDLRADET